MTHGMTRGRPRDPSVDERVIAIARDLLLEGGYAGFAIDEVADRARVAKTTLYRRWPSRDHLVAAAVATMLVQPPVADTGDLRADLLRAVTAIAARLREPAMAPLVAELVAAAARHHDLGASLRSLAAQRRQAAVELIARAITRGDLRADVDAAALVDQLTGPLYYRLLITGDPIPDDYISTLVDGILDGALDGAGPRPKAKR
jgi:AcrR family transcriptional regulator